jgi:hypothetical protein
MDAANAPDPRGCYTLTGTGSSQKCHFSASLDDAGADAGCPGDGGATFGRCPTKKLSGCCVYNPAPGDGLDGGGMLTATCYYVEDAAAPIFTCQGEEYDPGGYYWQTTAP